MGSKTPSDGTCLGERPGGFCYVGCHFIFDLHFIAVLHFVSRLLYHIIGTPPWLLRPLKASTSSELLIAFSFSSTASATVVSGHFLPTDVFYLKLIPDIFGTTCFYQCLRGSWQFFLEVCRALY